MMSASRSNMRFQLGSGLRHLKEPWQAKFFCRLGGYQPTTTQSTSDEHLGASIATTVRIPEGQGKRVALGGCAGIPRPARIPARPQFSGPRPSNSAMAACESPTIAIPTLLRNRS